MMKAYHFTFKGSYLGGNAVVLAYSLEEAQKIMREHLDLAGYADNKFELQAACEDGEPGMFYFDTGDY